MNGVTSQQARTLHQVIGRISLAHHNRPQPQVVAAVCFSDQYARH